VRVLASQGQRGLRCLAPLPRTGGRVEAVPRQHGFGRRGEVGVPVVVALTHDGVLEVEEGRLNPNRPTTHFPAAQTIVINAPISNSTIGQAGNQVSQQATYFALDLVATERVIREVRGALVGLPVDDAERRMIEGNLDLLEANARRSDDVGRRVVSEAWRSTRAILEGMAATGGYAALLHVLAMLPH
jgi:hypothetical protein